MQLPKIATTRSIKIEVEAGKTYKWCACGLSQTQPFCDGSHTSTNFKPVEYTPDENKLVGFCGCKHSKTAPLCDGSHKAFNL